MTEFEITMQLVDSPVDQSQSGGSMPADKLVEAFHAFPFADEIKRAEGMDGATFPTITFIRKSDREEIAIWTDDAVSYDMHLKSGSFSRFVNSQTPAQVEGMLVRFTSESVAEIAPKKKGLWGRLFG